MHFAAQLLLPSKHEAAWRSHSGRLVRGCRGDMEAVMLVTMCCRAFMPVGNAPHRPVQKALCQTQWLTALHMMLSVL